MNSGEIAMESSRETVSKAQKTQGKRLAYSSRFLIPDRSQRLFLAFLKVAKGVISVV